MHNAVCSISQIWVLLLMGSGLDFEIDAIANGFFPCVCCFEGMTGGVLGSASQIEALTNWVWVAASRIHLFTS